jgi:integrase
MLGLFYFTKPNPNLDKRGIPRCLLKGARKSNDLVFHSRRGSPLREMNALHEFLHPVLKTLGLPQAGMHVFCHGPNRRCKLAGINPAAVRQQMGHSSAVMTAGYTEEISLEQLRAVFCSMELENMEDGRSVRAVAWLCIINS